MAAYVKYALIALIGWGFWAIGSKYMTKYLNTTNIAFWLSVWPLIMLLIYFAVKRDLVVNRHIFIAIPVGIASLVAILAFYHALKIGPASVVVPLTNMYVIFPVLYGFILLKEPITLTRVLGIIFAVIATIFLSL